MNNETFITSSEMARLTGVPQPSIVGYANAGVIKPMKDSNGRRLYSRDDVEALIAYRKAKAARKAQPQAA